MFGHYILDANKLAVPVDMMTWAVWLETHDRVVAFEEIGDTYSVSTVFLGLDHSFTHDRVLIFETMIFITASWGLHYNERFNYYYHESLDYCDRCGTWDEALEMHERAVAHAQELLRQLPVVMT